MRTGERDLIEHRLVGTNEAPVVVVNGAIGHLERLANVKDLAVVVGVRVVAIAQAVAREGRAQLVAQKELGAGRELIEGPLDLC